VLGLNPATSFTILNDLVGVHADTVIEESNLDPRGLPEKYP